MSTRKDSDDGHAAYLSYKYKRAQWARAAQELALTWTSKNRLVPPTYKGKKVFGPACAWLHKNVHINISISYWRLVVDVESLSGILTLGQAILGVLDLSLVSVVLLNICSKMSLGYYKIVLFRDNFCEGGKKYQNPPIRNTSTFLQFIAVCQVPCGSFEETKEIYGSWDVAAHSCTMNCCQRKVNSSHLCTPWREV